MVGCARDSDRAILPDDRLLDVVQSNLKKIMGVSADPVFAKIYRHELAIPQYLVGHADRLQAIEARLERFPGLVLSGNAFRGVSLNDCVVNARATAEKIAGRERS